MSRSRQVRIGVFSSDPLACDSFHGFEPDSGLIFPIIADSLLVMGTDGRLQPGLATAWHRVDPVTIELEIRQGVRFHNGDSFGVDDVIATLRAHMDPLVESAQGRGILSMLASCERAGRHRVRITTKAPDTMIFHRLPNASAIYPARILESGGIRSLRENPIGTGAYRFREWRRGEEIVLDRHPHWSGVPRVDVLRFPILPHKDWVDALADRRLDIALNLDTHEAARAQRLGVARVDHRAAAFSDWFLLANRGPLADRRVRQALNHAVQRALLCEISDHGWAEPQASLLTEGQVGFDPDLRAYTFDPDRARHLLRDAGCSDGLTLRGLVSETCSSSYRLLRAFLANVGVTLDAEIVPRAVWMDRVVAGRMRGEPFAGDFAFAPVDNFTLHGAFHHSIFLWSRGAFSLTEDAEYDRRFRRATSIPDPVASHVALQELDRYARNEALMLFTKRPHVCLATRPGFHMPNPASGHFGQTAFWAIRVDPDAEPGVPSPPATSTTAAMSRLHAATRYPGVLYDPDDTPHTDPDTARLWRNLELQEERWGMVSEQMLAALVATASASTNLGNVLRATEEVGILGVGFDGRVLFENPGYERVMGHDGRVPLQEILLDDQGHCGWATAARRVEEDGSFRGPFWVLGRTGEPNRRVFLTATPATDEFASPVGFTCIVSDHSGEEERMRMSQELRVAERIQLAMLPEIPEPASKRIAACMRPADEVGGDYYDIIEDDTGAVWYGIGDVSGHGVTSGLIMLMTHCIIRTLIRATGQSSTVAVLESLNQMLYEHIQLLGERHHLTVGLLKSLGGGRYEVAGAHEDILIHRIRSGTVERVPLDGMFFGLLPDIAGIMTPRIVTLDPGDTMLLYTDGIVEAVGKDGSMWEMERLEQCLLEHAHLAPNELQSAIMGALDAYMARQEDDIALMVVRHPG